MPYIIIFLFTVSVVFSFMEDRMKWGFGNGLYLLALSALVLTAGLREIGIDPDSENYELTYRNYYTLAATNNTEFTFLALSAFFNIFTKDVHLLLLTYALLGVGLKMFAIRKFTQDTFLSLAIYISFYYCIHEVTQIRTGVLSGGFLLALLAIAQQKRLLGAVFLAIGSCFHVSGIALFPFLFLNNKEFNGKNKLFWICTIPMGYIIHFIGVGILLMLDLPFIGTKLALYQSAEETGLSASGINVFGPLYMLNIIIFYYLMYFSEVITKENKYFPIIMKVYAIGIVAYSTLSFLPVLAERISLLIRIVSIIILPCIMYTFSPRWVGIILVFLLGVIYLNYGLNYIDFQLLWKV